MGCNGVNYEALEGKIIGRMKLEYITIIELKSVVFMTYYTPPKFCGLYIGIMGDWEFCL